MATSAEDGLLTGIRVLEIGHFVAAPFCTRLLADLGGEVIKIEPRDGDPVRLWGDQVGGHSVWWSMHGRNKRSMTLDLKSPKAAEIVLELVKHCDVVVENFRPGQLAKLGLSDERLRLARPDLIIAHISGYGQDGPYAGRAAFGVIGEAIGGLRYLTNNPPGNADLPPVRVGVSIGDSIAGLYAAFGVAAALCRRDRQKGVDAASTIDVALTDAVLSITEGMLPEYGASGKIKQPTGGAIATAAPSNAYRTADGDWILIAANSDGLFGKLAHVMGRPELLATPDYTDNPSRVRNAASLDKAISDWSSTFTTEALCAALDAADIPNCRVYTVADCASDAQFLHRGMVREVDDPHFGSVLQTGIVPHVPERPGSIRWTGPALGQHTDEVLQGLLNLGPAEIRQLRQEGVI